MEPRIAALEAIVPTLATKSDLAEVRTDFAGLRAEFAGLRTEFAELRGALTTEMHKTDASIKTWMVATMVGLFVGFGGLFLAMSNALKPTASTTQPQQPTIIVVPTAAAPATVTPPAAAAPAAPASR